MPAKPLTCFNSALSECRTQLSSLTRHAGVLASVIAFMVGRIGVNGQRPLDSRRSYIQTFTNLHINVGLILLRKKHFFFVAVDPQYHW